MSRSQAKALFLCWMHNLGTQKGWGYIADNFDCWDFSELVEDIYEQGQ